MAVESKNIFFFPNYFFPKLSAVDEDKKAGYNYKPLFTNKVVLPQLCFINIPNPKLISTKHNPNLIEFEDPSPCLMEEAEPIKVVRSAVSDFLLKRFEERQMFTPIDTKGMMYFLKKDRLLAPFEKRALLEVGQEDEDENEIMISALNSALVSIQADTEAVNCYYRGNSDDVYKERVCVLAIQPDKLVNELLPVSLHLEDLALSPEELFPNLDELQALELERLRALRAENY
ncbi:hypothetical protein RND81_09G105400 [Saponaria officinalis]|uniref:Uncharacterized protein n=1 Tax=Saponaria officinalis TaxID=3572 RepID=A0AAW1IKS5_SAPOF